MKDKDQLNNNEEKKSKKRRTASQFFTSLNTSKNNKNIDNNSSSNQVVTNAKSKWVKWVFVAGIATVVGVGIGLPISQANNAINVQLPINPNENAISIGNGITISFADFEKQLQQMSSLNDKELERVKNSFYASGVLKQLYDDEHNSWLSFKKVVDKLKGIDLKPTDLGYDASKSYDEIKNAKKNELNDAKKLFSNNSSYQNWEEAWIKELKTNAKYGNPSGDSISQLEANAVEYLTNQNIKQVALARFEKPKILTTINNSGDNKVITWNKNDLNRIANDPSLIDPKNDIRKFLISDLNNPSCNVASNPNDLVISVYQNNSYNFEFRNPFNTIANQRTSLINQILNYSEMISISSFSIPLSLDQTKGTWNVSKDLLKKFLTPIYPSTTGPSNFIVPINVLSSFQGANPNLLNNDNVLANNQQILNDKTLVKLFKASTDSNSNNSTPPSTYSSLPTTKDTQQPPSDGNNGTTSSPSELGSLGVKTLSELLNNSDNQVKLFNLAAISTNSFNDNNSPFKMFNVKNVNPINIFISELKKVVASTSPITSINGIQFNYSYVPSENLKALFRSLNTWFDTTSSNNFYKPQYIDRIISQIGPLIDQLQEGDLAYLGRIMALCFADKDAILGYKEDGLNLDAASRAISYEQNNFSQIANPPATSAKEVPYMGSWTLYDLSPTSSSSTNLKTYLFVGKTEIKIFTTTILKTTNSDLNTMIKNDLQQSALNKTLNFNVNEMFTDVTNDDYIINNLLNDQNIFNKFLDYLVQKSNNKIDKNKATQIVNIFKQTLTIKAQNKVMTNRIGSVSNINAFIKDLSIDYSKYDFSFRSSNQGQNDILNFVSGNNPNVPIKGITKIEEWFANSILNVFLKEKRNA